MSKVQAKFIGRKGSAVILEYVEGVVPQRAIVSAAKVINLDEKARVATVYQKDLDESIPYGIPWDALMTPVVVTPEDICKALRSVGVWTYEDFKANPSMVNAALGALTREIREQINLVARNFRTKEIER